MKQLVVLAATALVASVSGQTIADPGVGVLIGDGTVSFVPSGVDRADLPASLALVEPARGQGPVPSGFGVAPLFSKDARGWQVATIAIEPGTSLYGTGEIAGPLLRNGWKSETWNYDAYGYDETYPNLYQAHPWVLAVRADGTSFGVLADTTWRCEMDLTDGITFRAGGEPYQVVVIESDSPQAVVRRLARLTGRIELPPKWALGYHQCRYSYYPEDRVREIATEFRQRDIPCDVIWFDIDYMDEYRVFTFDESRFPDPAALNAELHDAGYHTIWMIDPGVKAEAGYGIYDAGEAGDHWVKNAAGDTYYGDVWPGRCVFPDYTRPETQEWWATLYEPFMNLGIDGVWNDMNEPAVFNVSSKTMPEDNHHRGGGRLLPGPHAKYHNVYGMLMVRSTLEGIRRANPEKRPFVLTRANFIGGHRYAATWTGDNSAEWDDLEASIPMIINMGLSGQPFVGPDIGGFNGNGDGELFERWMGIGALFPFSRGHTGKGNIDKEPWAYDESVETTSRYALQRRYRLVPYLYTLFWQASTDGLPIMRPVFFADPTDPALRSEDDAFLLGGDILAIGGLTPDKDRAVVLPKGDWKRLTMLGRVVDEDLPELRVRPGAIVPLGPVMEYVDEKPLDPITLVVNLDDTGRAEGILYEDAGEGYGYKTGEFLLTRYVAERNGSEITVDVKSTRGNMQRPRRVIRVRLLTERGPELTGEGTDGRPIKLLDAPHEGY